MGSSSRVLFYLKIDFAASRSVFNFKVGLSRLASIGFSASRLGCDVTSDLRWFLIPALPFVQSTGSF